MYTFIYLIMILIIVLIVDFFVSGISRRENLYYEKEVHTTSLLIKLILAIAMLVFSMTHNVPLFLIFFPYFLVTIFIDSLLLHMIEDSYCSEIEQLFNKNKKFELSLIIIYRYIKIKMKKNVDTD